MAMSAESVYFAQFVDMHARPSAKLVPAASLDELVSRTAPASPGSPPGTSDSCRAIYQRLGGDPGPDQFHAGSVGADPGPLRVRHPRGGRGVAVRPAHHSAAAGRESGGEGLRVHDRHGARVLPAQAARGRLDRDRGLARHAREALLRPQGPDPQLRVSRHGLAVRERARLGELRERSRGRERPVRAELHVHGRAGELRPGNLLPVHGALACGAARNARDLHAQALHRADRKRLPLPPVAVGRGPQPVPRRG